MLRFWLTDSSDKESFGQGGSKEVLPSKLLRLKGPKEAPVEARVSPFFPSRADFSQAQGFHDLDAPVITFFKAQFA